MNSRVLPMDIYHFVGEIKISVIITYLCTVLTFLVKIKADVLDLNLNNFKEEVFQSSDAWIVYIFTDTADIKELSQQAVHMSGTIKFGKIKYDEFVKFLKKEDVPARNYIMDNFRVYPYGQSIHKQRKWQNHYNSQSAIENAMQSIPDTSTKMPDDIVKHQQELKSLFQKSYANLVPTIPVIYITDEKMTPPFYRAAAVKYSSLFYFTNLINPSVQTLTLYRALQLPHLAVLLIKKEVDGKFSMGTVVYNPDIHGDMSFKNVSRFLFLVHKEYFKALPAIKERNINIDPWSLFKPYFKDAEDLIPISLQKQKNTEKGNKEKSFGKGEKKEREQIQERDERKQKEPEKERKRKEYGSKYVCSNKEADVCIFLLSKGQKSSFRIQDLNPLLSETRSQDKVVEVYQLSIPCHDEFEFIFDIDEEEIPSALILLPKKRLFNLSSKISTTDGLIHFIKSTLTGNRIHVLFEKIPKARTSACLQNITSMTSSYDRKKGESQNSRESKTEL